MPTIYAHLYAAANTRLRGGLAYWSISPAVSFRTTGPSRVPIGFGDDTSYHGDRPGKAVLSTLAVPPMIASIRDLDAFRYMTALALLRARNLALVSVWRPSFLSLLLAAMAERWDELIRNVRSGRPGIELDEPVRHAFDVHAGELASWRAGIGRCGGLDGDLASSRARQLLGGCARGRRVPRATCHAAERRVPGEGPASHRSVRHPAIRRRAASRDAVPFLRVRGRTGPGTPVARTRRGRGKLRGGHHRRRHLPPSAP